MTRTIVTFCLAFLCVWGCVPFIPFTTGEPLHEDRLEAIMPGKMMKQDLLDLFGPPAAIVTQHEIAAIPTPQILPAREASFKLITTEYRFQSDTFFELFTPGREISEYHRIYYYDYIVSSETFYVFLLAFYGSGKTTTDRLWALVNEKTGVVEDYVFKKYNQKAFFGRNP